MLNSLCIEKYSVQVHLGCEEAERRLTQEVQVNLEVRFPEILQAAFSDELKDTLCYAELCQCIEQVAKARHYKLIEKLGMDCFEALKAKLKDFSPGAELAIEIHKMKPPVPKLLGGSIYRLGDFWL